jgi:aspartate/methionine/tyrosine aminotransferase
MQPFINTNAQSVSVYASKVISGRAKSDATISNLAIGEPDFGPPEHLADTIRAQHLTYGSFINAVKQYEQSRGLRELRCAISQWYLSRYNYRVDPDTELLITHGGVEAIALAILCTSDPGDTIMVTDPTYMLYGRSVQTLARVPVPLIRRADSEYLGMLDDTEKMAGGKLARARALIVNSPENPTGYVVDEEEWQALSMFAQARNLWIVHDEVYDTMAFARPHRPARCVEGLEDRAILVNSFSKKFGVPGLRIGWLCAKPELISVAAKLHDYLYLGVNVLFEQIALTLIGDDLSAPWLEFQTKMLRKRVDNTVGSLTPGEGFSWDRRPLGGMFAFPNVAGLSDRIPQHYLERHRSRGDAVAEFLLEQQKVAVVPGSIYGLQGNDFIRLVLCCGEATLEDAMNRLKSTAATRHRDVCL